MTTEGGEGGRDAPRRSLGWMAPLLARAVLLLALAAAGGWYFVSRGSHSSRDGADAAAPTPAAPGMAASAAH